MEYPGMGEFEASEFANEILDELTANDELHSRVTIRRDNLLLDTTVTFKEHIDSTNWVDIVVSESFLDGYSSYVSSRHPVVDGTPVITPKLYEVVIVEGGGDLIRVNKNGYPADAVYERMIPRLAEQYRKITAKALQVLERVELGLKRKLES